MGKKVFEVAKELGVKHEALLKRCDDLGITAKNYMAELSDRDAARLRSAVEAENTRPADDKAGAPGVVRRRKAAEPRPCAGTRCTGDAPQGHDPRGHHPASVGGTTPRRSPDPSGGRGAEACPCGG